MATMRIGIEGMHCAACVRRLTEAFERTPGVRFAQVTLNPPGAHIEGSGVSVESLDRAARSAGDYRVVPRDDAPAAGAHDAAPAADEPPPSLYPLILIVAFILGVSALTTFVRADGAFHTWMNDFMAGFFLVFSFFKLLDLRGFADAYQSYDIVARRLRGWALAYPFLELALGVAYLLRWRPMLTNSITLAVMLVGSIGVLRALLRRDRIRCACLGTALNLPMTTVTLVEDLGMAGMAAAMLVWGA